MSKEELVVMKEWLEDNMTKGFRCQSSSPYVAPCLFAKKPDGGLRLCIDHWNINSKTVEHRYTLPLMRETLNLLEESQMHTKLDLRGAYNQVWVKEGEENKLAFRTRYGLFKPLVMQFGTTNAPAAFQGYINNTIRESLDNFASAYLDDILIYSNSVKEHEQHVQRVMECLLISGLYLNAENCEFHKNTVKYFGLIISRKGIVTARRNRRCHRLHSFRYAKGGAGIRGKEVTHLAGMETRVLEERKEPVVVGK